MEAMQVSPEETIYIGDSDVDMQTGRNAGTATAWVSWGFRKRVEMTGCEVPVSFDTPEALRDWLLSE